MRAKKDTTAHPDYQHPDMKRVQATRNAIADMERKLTRLREQLDADVCAAMTPPAGAKLPYGRVKRLQLLFGYEDNSNLYRMRDRSIERTKKSTTKNADNDNDKDKDKDKEHPAGDDGNVTPGRMEPAAV